MLTCPTKLPSARAGCHQQGIYLPLHPRGMGGTLQCWAWQCSHADGEKKALRPLKHCNTQGVAVARGQQRGCHVSNEVIFLTAAPRILPFLLSPQVGLVIVDEVHLLGAEEGHTLEVVVSSLRRTAPTSLRFLGLATALANAGDLAAWLGVAPEVEGCGMGKVLGRCVGLTMQSARPGL